MLDAMNDAVKRLIGHSSMKVPELQSGVSDLILFQSSVTTPIEAALHEPAIGLILQGEKEICWGNTVERIGPGSSVIVSHDLPVMSRVTRASERQPYRSIVFVFGQPIVRGLIDKLEIEDDRDTKSLALSVSKAEPDFLDALSRYLNLASGSSEASVLAPLIRTELHYRALVAPHGAMLRRAANRNDHAARIGLAVTHLRKNYRLSLHVSELAAISKMSVSSFHTHFRAVTATTPIQYQKDLRLIEARRMLRDEEATVAEAANAVGYESTTQFTREFRRKYGKPPREERSSWRNNT
ncbi:MAG: AraC family transcriptional regulator [Planctomycetota bacterium]